MKKTGLDGSPVRRAIIRDLVTDDRKGSAAE